MRRRLTLDKTSLEHYFHYCQQTAKQTDLKAKQTDLLTAKFLTTLQ